MNFWPACSACGVSGSRMRRAPCKAAGWSTTGTAKSGSWTAGASRPLRAAATSWSKRLTGRGSGNRQADGDGGSDLTRAAGGVSKADAVVAHRHGELVRGDGERDRDPGSAGVARDVAQRLVVGLEHRGGVVLGQLGVCAVDHRQFTTDAGALLELVRVPFDGRRKAQRAEQDRAELGGDLTGPRAVAVQSVPRSV